MTAPAPARDLAGRHFLVSGANTGIGLSTARELLRRGGRVLVACRSEDKTRPVLEALRAEISGAQVDFVPLDLGDLDSVRACAARVLALGEPLHVLINNAGLAGQRGLTKSGFELAFGTNHLGTFLLTSLLTDKLLASAPARVVNVASTAHFSARGIDWESLRKPTRTVSGTREYAVSKLCNVLHARELGRRLAGKGVTTYSLHPGVIASDVWRRVPWPIRPMIKLFMQSPEQGARTSLYCATAPELSGETGRYYDHCQARPASALADDAALAAELWRRSEAWTAA